MHCGSQEVAKESNFSSTTVPEPFPFKHLPPFFKMEPYYLENKLVVYFRVRSFKTGPY